MFIFFNIIFAFILLFHQSFAINFISNKKDIEGCNKQYVLFFCDKSYYSKYKFNSQLNIIELYFGNNYQTLDEIFVSIVGEGSTMETNNFGIVKPKDVNSLNTYILNLIKLPYSQNNISYLNLLQDFYNDLSVSDKNEYTNYPAILFFINSYLEDLSSTKNLLQNIKNEKMKNVKTLAIIFDKIYLENAKFLVGDNNVYYFDEGNLYKDVASWIFNTICMSSEISTTTTTTEISPIYSTSTELSPTTSKITPISNCKSYISISIDTNSQSLNKGQFNFIKNVIQNNISSLITNYSKVSIDSFDIKYNRWFTFGEIRTIQEFMMNIYIVRQRTMSNFYLLIQRLNMLPIPYDWRLSTYIFISHISMGEINKSIDEAKILKNKGTLNFIILGNDSLVSYVEILQPSNIFVWNLTTSTINNLETFFKNSMACDYIF